MDICHRWVASIHFTYRVSSEKKSIIINQYFYFALSRELDWATLFFVNILATWLNRTVGVRVHAARWSAIKGTLWQLKEAHNSMSWWLSWVTGPRMMVLECVCVCVCRPLTRVAAIFYFANMAAPGVICLGAQKKLNRYGMDNIWAKFGAFARIWTEQLILCPKLSHYLSLFVY